jgi:CubicO group peptidase (beta-lactamase class C family)
VIPGALVPVFALLGTIFSLAAPAPAWQTAGSPAKAAQALERVEEYLERASAFGFSGSVLVAREDRVLLARGYGIADRKTGAACAVDTLYDLGSLSKQFTATLVLVLEQRGVFSTDDPLTDFFDDVPADKRGITLHHLLTHTSGLPRGLMTVGSRSADREEMIRAALAAPLASKPGQSHLYSNLGYEVLAAAVERAAERPFEELMREHLFAVAGLASTGFRRDGRLAAARAARGLVDATEPPSGSQWASNPNRYEGSGDEKLLATDGWYSWGLRGAGGILSTVEDLWRWELALRGDRVLTPASRKKLFTPFKGNYAYGWYVMKDGRGEDSIAHGGTTGNGFDVYATRVPEEDLFYTTLGNVLGVVPWVHAHVGKLLAGQQLESPPASVVLAAEESAARSGEWRGTGGGRFLLTDAGGAWRLEACDQDAFELLHGSTDVGSLLRRSAEVVNGFVQADFAALHAAESPERPLSFMEDWWKRLLAHHGALRTATVLGVAPSAARWPGQSGAVILRLEFERGAELFTMTWMSGVLTGVNVGPPYPSVLRLVPTGRAEAVAWDLVAARAVAQIEFASNGRTATLTAAHGDTKLTRP